MIRLKFDEEDAQEEYLAIKLTVSKLSEVLFTLGVYDTMLNSNNDTERNLGIKGIKHIVSLFDDANTTRPDIVTEDEAHNLVEMLVKYIVTDKMPNSIDNAAYLAVKEAEEGKAHASSLNGDVVDLVFGDGNIDEDEIERIFSLVENTPIKKVKA